MVVEFLKYWLHNFSVGFHFGGGVFSYISGICAFISAGLFLLKKHYQHKWKRWEQIIMRTAFCLFVISFIIATFLVAPFLKDKSNKQEISELKRDLTAPKQTLNTKQDIRNFLEAVNPEILQRIDAGQTLIPIRLSFTAEERLKKLSKQPDFNKFLILEKRVMKKEDIDTFFIKAIGTGLIKELNKSGPAYYWADYYLLPRNALIK